MIQPLTGDFWIQICLAFHCLKIYLGLFLFVDGKAYRSGDKCHWKDNCLLIVPKRRVHVTPHRATWGSSRVGHEAEGVRGKPEHFIMVVAGRNGWGKSRSWAGLGLGSLNHFVGLWGVGVVSNCLIPDHGVIQPQVHLVLMLIRFTIS